MEETQPRRGHLGVGDAIRGEEVSNLPRRPSLVVAGDDNGGGRGQAHPRLQDVDVERRRRQTPHASATPPAQGSGHARNEVLEGGISEPDALGLARRSRGEDHVGQLVACPRHEGPGIALEPVGVLEHEGTLPEFECVGQFPRTHHLHRVGGLDNSRDPRHRITGLHGQPRTPDTFDAEHGGHLIGRGREDDSDDVTGADPGVAEQRPHRTGPPVEVGVGRVHPPVSDRNAVRELGKHALEHGRQRGHVGLDGSLPEILEGVLIGLTHQAELHHGRGLGGGRSQLADEVTQRLDGPRGHAGFTDYGEIPIRPQLQVSAGQGELAVGKPIGSRRRGGRAARCVPDARQNSGPGPQGELTDLVCRSEVDRGRHTVGRGDLHVDAQARLAAQALKDHTPQCEINIGRFHPDLGGEFAHGGRVGGAGRVSSPEQEIELGGDAMQCTHQLLEHLHTSVDTRHRVGAGSSQGD